MQITQTQLDSIQSLRVCRLRDAGEQVLRSLDEEYFYNSNNDNVAQVLRNEASQEDIDNSKAYYVILDKDNDVLFFFSLKTGSLYDQYIDVRIWQKLDMLLKELSVVPIETYNKDELSVVEEIKEKLRSMKGLTKADLERIPKKGITVFDDLEKEFNENITHVGATYAGIELVHFCANEGMQDKIQSLNLGRRIGVVVFWQFVVDAVLEIMKHIGCEYLYLFAADQSKDEDLMRYYSSQLQFADDKDVSTAKPIYDLTCRFMYQRLSDIEERRRQFFEHYNLEDV